MRGEAERLKHEEEMQAAAKAEAEADREDESHRSVQEVRAFEDLSTRLLNLIPHRERVGADAADEMLGRGDAPGPRGDWKGRGGRGDQAGGGDIRCDGISPAC